MSSKVEYAKIAFTFSDDKKIVYAVAASLSPEAIESSRLSFKVSTTNGGRTLLLNFSARDLVSLRAGMNTMLRLTLSALKSIRAASYSSFEQNAKLVSQKD